MGSRQASKAHATKAITDKKVRCSQVFNRLIKSYHSTVQPRGRRPCSRTTVYVSAWRNRTDVMWWRTRHFYRLHVGRMRDTASICDNPIAFILTSRPALGFRLLTRKTLRAWSPRCCANVYSTRPRNAKRTKASVSTSTRRCKYFCYLLPTQTVLNRLFDSYFNAIYLRASKWPARLATSQPRCKTIWLKAAASPGAR